MYGALYGACMVHVWCISTILYGANRLQCTGERSADYGGDARLIRVHIEWVQKKKIAGQYKSCLTKHYFQTQTLFFKIADG